MRSCSLPVCGLAVIVCLPLGGVPLQAQTVSSSAPVSKPPVSQETREPEWRWGAASFGGDFSMTSTYVWRGWVLDSGSCVQLDGWARVGDFTGTTWASVSTNGMRIDEYDFTVDYEHETRHVTLLAGWINYNYKVPGEHDGHTNELYAGLRLNAVLEPSVLVYHDPQLGDGSYVKLSANHDFPVAGRVSGNAQVSVGYNRHQWTTVSGWSDVVATVTFRIKLRSARMTLEPSFAYSHSLMPGLFGSRGFGTLAAAIK